MGTLRRLPARSLGGPGPGWQTYIFNVSLEPDEDGWRVLYPPLEHFRASAWEKTQAETLSHIHAVLSMIVEECPEVGCELLAGDGRVITEGTAVVITR